MGMMGQFTSGAQSRPFQPMLVSSVATAVLYCFLLILSHCFKVKDDGNGRKGPNVVSLRLQSIPDPSFEELRWEDRRSQQSK
jgi:hypothetical protein